MNPKPGPKKYEDTFTIDGVINEHSCHVAKGDKLKVSFVSPDHVKFEYDNSSSKNKDYKKFWESRSTPKPPNPKYDAKTDAVSGTLGDPAATQNFLMEAAGGDFAPTKLQVSVSKPGATTLDDGSWTGTGK